MTSTTISQLRTIAVRARKAGSRWSRLRVEYPTRARGSTMPPPYDVAMAWQLLALTGEAASASRRVMRFVMNEQRRALFDLATALDPEQKLAPTFE